MEGQFSSASVHRCGSDGPWLALPSLYSVLPCSLRASLESPLGRSIGSPSSAISLYTNLRQTFACGGSTANCLNSASEAVCVGKRREPETRFETRAAHTPSHAHALEVWARGLASSGWPNPNPTLSILGSSRKRQPQYLSYTIKFGGTHTQVEQQSLTSCPHLLEELQSSS